MILTTTQNIEGHNIDAYLDLLIEESSFGGAWPAVQKMVEIATELGANAIIGISLDCRVVRENSLLYIVLGTAVRVSEIKKS